MPKVEKAIHLDAYKLYVEMGGLNKAFLAAFGNKFGKSDRTAFRWAAEFDWERRAAEPAQAAIAELQEAGKLRTEELIEGLLDLSRVRMDSVDVKTGYLDAIFATVFERIKTPQNPNPENPIEITNIGDLTELIRANTQLIRAEQGYMKIVLALVGEPEQVFDDQMLVEFVGLDENVFKDAERRAAEDDYGADSETDHI
jgi:hypothetical protein